MYSLDFPLIFHRIGYYHYLQIVKNKTKFKRWNKLTKVTFVNGGRQGLNQSVCLQTPRSSPLGAHFKPWYSPSPSSFLQDFNTCDQFSVHTPLRRPALVSPVFLAYHWRLQNLIQKERKGGGKLNKILQLCFILSLSQLDCYLSD